MTHCHRALMAGLATLMLTSLPIATTRAAAAQTTVDITIDNFTFTPPDLTIAAGTTVRWTNLDDIPHAVAEKALSFRSKALDTGDSYTATFDKPGTVEYFCTLHPHMTGRITVLPAPP